MNLQRTFTVEADEKTACDRLTAFLEKSGYRRSGSQPWPSYQRGSKLGSLIGFSPRHWQVNAEFQITSVSGQSQVSVALDIDTTGQWVTEKERRFWNTELDNLVQSVQSGDIDIASGETLAQSSFRENALSGVIIIGLMVIFAVGARLLFASRLAFWGGAVLGALLAVWITGRWLKFKIGGGM